MKIYVPSSVGHASLGNLGKGIHDSHEIAKKNAMTVADVDKICASLIAADMAITEEDYLTSTEVGKTAEAAADEIQEKKQAKMAKKQADDQKSHDAKIAKEVKKVEQGQAKSKKAAEAAAAAFAKTGVPPKAKPAAKPKAKSKAPAKPKAKPAAEPKATVADETKSIDPAADQSEEE